MDVISFPSTQIPTQLGSLCSGSHTTPSQLRSHGGHNERHQKFRAVCLAFQHSSQVWSWREEGCVRGAWSLGSLQDRVEQLSIITSLRHSNENSILPSCHRYQQGQVPHVRNRLWFLSCVAAYPAYTKTMLGCRGTEMKGDKLLEAEGMRIICSS